MRSQVRMERMRLGDGVHLRIVQKLSSAIYARYRREQPKSSEFEISLLPLLHAFSAQRR